jgi:hypothetical protein
LLLNPVSKCSGTIAFGALEQAEVVTCLKATPAPRRG